LPTLVEEIAMVKVESEWIKFRSDKEWQSVKAESEKDGPITRRADMSTRTTTSQYLLLVLCGFLWDGASLFKRLEDIGDDSKDENVYRLPPAQAPDRIFSFSKFARWT
jgi:hypothetical protein